MLGKRPCLLRTTSSRSLLIPCEDMEGEPTTLCNYAQVAEKNPRLTSSAPCKVVIGFDIGTEKKTPSDACESPRSVLDSLALLPSQEKQQVVARSPRSGLGTLLTAQSGSGVGPAMVTQIHDDEVGVHVDSVAGSFKTAFHSQNCLHETCSDKTSLSFKSSQYHSKDIPSWGRHAPNSLCVEDERLDADISPLRSQAMFVPSSQDMNAKFTDIYISPHQIRALDACIENAFKEGCSHAVSGVASYGPGSEGAGDGCKTDHTSTLQSEAWSFCEDECTDTHIAPRQRQALHQVSLDMESEEISIQQSIFSATSPPSCPHSLTTSFPGFLKVCSYCGHSLRLGKDIFMYRGDQAFCSADCRYQKIVLDESKEKQGR